MFPKIPFFPDGFRIRLGSILIWMLKVKILVRHSPSRNALHILTGLSTSTTKLKGCRFQQDLRQTVWKGLLTDHSVHGQGRQIELEGFRSKV